MVVVVILFNLLKMGEIYKSKLNTYIRTCRRSSSNSRIISVSNSVSNSRGTGSRSSSSSSGDSSGGRGSISCGRWWW